MQIKHVCQSCGEVMEVHEHSNYQQIKDCNRERRALCDRCRSWPGCSLPEAGTREQRSER